MAIIRVISEIVIKYELLIGIDFLNTIRVTINAEEIVISALTSIPENKEIRGIYQLDSDSNGINKVDVTYMPKTKYRNLIIENLIDGYKPWKAWETEVAILLKNDKLSEQNREKNRWIHKLTNISLNFERIVI